MAQMRRRFEKVGLLNHFLNQNTVQEVAALEKESEMTTGTGITGGEVAAEAMIGMIATDIMEGIRMVAVVAGVAVQALITPGAEEEAAMTRSDAVPVSRGIVPPLLAMVEVVAGVLPHAGALPHAGLPFPGVRALRNTVSMDILPILVVHLQEVNLLLPEAHLPGILMLTSNSCDAGGGHGGIVSNVHLMASCSCWSFDHDVFLIGDLDFWCCSVREKI
ncbi:uncharacterized protein LOC120004003 isoform X2 [Tripterygium wilfordii]|uniref:uncharacterized protein LOC120004003 isoform X2 n=1 Tax=Tripterygium wilfordii TaxID=458696 RepID=UPI0018F85DC4|nr:uncharacterized protein LOC120004003 isoform X2 [Tripterygium wilfordii]